MNELTRRLMAEGYTKDHHPDYVQYVEQGYESGFEYTLQYLSTIVWESPCGLLITGIGHEFGSHEGVDYCPENDNPRFGCPFHPSEVKCAHRFNIKVSGWNCAFHQVVRDFDYSISVQRLEDQHDAIRRERYEKLVGRYGNCRCISWNRQTQDHVVQFDVERCIQHQCMNKVCAVTKQPRDLQKVNIYFDALREWHFKRGLFVDVKRQLTKGERQFKTAIHRTDAEIWLKLNRDKVYRPVSLYDQPTREKGYDSMDFFYSVQNIRIEMRVRRDLAQDLADIAEGLTVVHASDRKKAQVEEKRERKRKRQEYRQRRIQQWVDCLADDTSTDEQKQQAEQELIRSGLDRLGNKLPRIPA